MRIRLLFSALIFCLCAAAQTRLTVNQLVSFVQSSIKLKTPDREVAGYLSKVKMTERLDDRTIEDLQGQGAGTKTVAALKALRDASQGLAKSAPVVEKAPPPPIPPPSAAEQARILDEVREYALNYSRRLPDFICTEVARRYYDLTGQESWRLSDTLTIRLSYFEQKEQYKLVLINNQPTERAYESVGGAFSMGEWASMMRQIFERESRTQFDWARWATLRGRRVYVFSFRIQQIYSRYRINYANTQEVVVGYSGEVFIDKDTGMVMRIKMEAENIPPAFPVRQASTLLDYDYVKISDRTFLLPLRAVIRMRGDKNLATRNDEEFHLYRKYSADASITFDTPEPLADDQTKEQPPK